MLRIEDPRDDRLDVFRECRNRADVIVIEGELAVERALRSGVVVQAVAATPSHLARLGPHLARVPRVFEVENPVLRAVLGFPFHRGCVALAVRPELADDPIAHMDALMRKPSSTVVIADRLADPVNVGALVRTARALFVDRVLLSRGCADPFSPRAVRACVGHVFAQPVSFIDDLPAFLRVCGERFPALGRVAAVTSPAAVSLDRFERPAHVAIVLGNEGEGLDASVRAHVETQLRVPMREGIDSLNVVAATAILLWELRPAGCA